MKTNFHLRTSVCLAGFIAAGAWPSLAADLSINPATIPSVGQVDKRFQSYNIEMLEVTGGQFWKPYGEMKSKAADTPPSAQAGLGANLFQYRPPIDLSNARLRKLAAALGPAYVRVSGTWANSTYFYDSDGPPPATVPDGFKGVLTRQQWKGVVDFAKAVDAGIVTSVATSEGTRNAEGAWTANQARAVLAYTKLMGGKITATEFMNEPNFAAPSRGAPKDYDAAAYARDVARFRPFLKEASPETLFLGPGSVGEGGPLEGEVSQAKLGSEAMMKATGPAYDVFSYHIYAAVSQRCAGGNARIGTTPMAGLSAEWLSRSDSVAAFYKGLRDRFEPGKPLWVTETADAACGGNPWAATFLDTFRYLDQHAALAQQGIRVVAHNTLAASDYGLLDEKTYAPRPNYWAALLWNKLMGTTVLKPASEPSEGLRVYAQCMKGAAGGVTVLVINTNRNEAKSLSVSVASQRYTMTAPKLEDTRVDLNGEELKLGAGDAFPELQGVSAPAGAIVFPPASITFLAVPEASSDSCR